MSDLWLPQKTRKEIQKDKWADQRAQQRAMVEQMLDFDDPVCVRWNTPLQKLDPRLRLGRGKPVVRTGWGIRPGFYHWVRDNETAPLTVTAITTSDDGFREPDSGVLEDLRRSDLQNPEVFMRLLDQRAKKEAYEERCRTEERERRQEEIMDRYLAGTRVQVSMKDGWSQNAAGMKGRK